MTERFAVYLTLAADSELYQLASKWLGHDYYQTDKYRLECDHPVLNEINKNQAITRKASQYGFHSTLKPPFRLRAGNSVDQLRSDLHRLAKVHQAFVVSPLSVDAIGSFIVLRPTQDCIELNLLADHSVQAFEPYRAELTEVEIKKRQAENLTVQQNFYLKHWGYPYVFDEFRWHFTLTDALSDLQMEKIRALMKGYFIPAFRQPLKINQISLMHQKSPTAPFTVIETALLERRGNLFN